MQSKALTPGEYIAALPPDRQQALRKLRSVIKKNLPEGFEEVMSYGMIGYVVPHKIYPAGYHVNPALPLGLMNIASQKNFIAVYHMGLYANPALLKWFTAAHAKVSAKRLDMGKGCIRFKKPEDIPYDLIGELAGRLTPAEWVARYESMLHR